MLWYLATAAGVLFVSALIYSQYALLRVVIDRRRQGGTGWLFPWWQLSDDACLSEQGRVFRSRYLRSMLISLIAFLVCVVALDLSG